MMSTYLSSSERNGIVELALQTDSDVYGPGGERDMAQEVISSGLVRLSELNRYSNSSNEVRALELEAALQSLKVALYQRYQTVDEFNAQALEAVL